MARDVRRGVMAAGSVTASRFDAGVRRGVGAGWRLRAARRWRWHGLRREVTAVGSVTASHFRGWVGPRKTRLGG